MFRWIGRYKPILILLAVSALSIFFAHRLTQSVEFTTVLFVLSYGVMLLLVEPYVGLIIFLVFYYLRPHSFLPGFIGFPIILIIGASTLAAMLLHLAVKQRSLDLVKAPQNYAILWFVVAMMLSHAVRGNLSGAINAAYGYSSTFVLYLLIANLVDSVKRLRITLHVVAFMTVLVSLPGILAYHFGTGMFSESEMFARSWSLEAKGGRIEGIGIFSDPNALALTLLLMLPFFYLLMTKSKEGIVRLYAVISMLVLSYGVYLTNSRGGALSFGGLVTILFARRFGIPAGAFVGVVGFLVLFQMGPSRMQEVSVIEASARGRVVAWNAGLNMFQSSPVFGVGKGRFTAYHHIAAHNSFINCAAELGLVGLIPWVLMIYLSIKNLMYIGGNAVGPQYRGIDYYADATLFGLVAYVLAATFLSFTYRDQLIILVGLAVAATRIFVNLEGKEYRLFEKRDLVNATLVSIGGLVIFKVFALLTAG